MSAQTFETFLARLYTDKGFRDAFLELPEQCLRNEDLTREETDDLLRLDRPGILMASHSFQHKMEKRKLRKRSIFQRMFSYICKLVSTKCLLRYATFVLLLP